MIKSFSKEIRVFNEQPDLMYYWAYSEAPVQVAPLPHKLQPSTWPPDLPEGEEVVGKILPNTHQGNS